MFRLSQPSLDITHWLQRAKAIFTLREYETWAEPTLLLATIPSQAPHGTLAVRDNARWLSHLLRVASAHGSLAASESRSATANLEELESAGQTLLSHSTRQLSHLESGDINYFQESVALQTRFRIRSAYRKNRPVHYSLSFLRLFFYPFFIHDERRRLRGIGISPRTGVVSATTRPNNF